MTEPGRGREEARWHRVRAGQGDAFAGLYEHHADAVFGFCLRRLGSWHEAEDCTSLVFLEAWRLRGTLRDGVAPRTWLLGIAVNVARNAARAKRRHRALLARLPLDQDTAEFENDAAGRLDAEPRAQAVAAALRQLSRREREVLALAAGGELTTAQIAEALGIPAGTVKSRLSRARAKLAAASQTTVTRLAEPGYLAGGAHQ